MSRTPGSRWFIWASRLAGCWAAVMGGLVLMGWALDLATLKSVSPGLPQMVPNAALGFVMAGLSLWLLSSEPVGPVRRRIAQAAALIVTLIGAVTVGESVFGWQPGIDQLLFRENLQALATPVAGRLSILTAVCFLLYGLSLLVVELDLRRVDRWLVDLLVVVPIEITLLALIGYACNVPSFYGWRSLLPNTTMALHTAVTLAVLGLGLLCLRPDRGLMQTIVSATAGGVVARRLLLAPVVIPLLTGLALNACRRAGFYNAEFAGWLLSFLNIFIFTLVIWWIAVLLQRTDGVRERAEQSLREAKVELEARVQERTLELVQSNERLGTSEARLAGIVNSAMDAIISVDNGQKIVLFNAAAERMFRCPATDAVGQQLDRFIPQRFREHHRQHVEGFAKTGVTSRSMRSLGALSGLRADGEEFPIEASISQVEVAGQKLFTVILRDITDRKQAEEALKASETRLRQIIDLVPVYIFAKDRDGRFLLANRKIAEAFGKTPAEVEGRTQLELVSVEAEAQAYLKADREVIDSRQPKFVPQETFTSPAGVVHVLQTSKIPFVVPETRELAVLGVSVDITDLKRIEAEVRRLNEGLEERIRERTAQLEGANLELRQSRAELNSLFESLPGLYLVLTPDFRIVAASDAYLKATMTTREGIVGRGLFEMFPDNPDDPAATGVANLRASLDRVRRTAAPDTMAIQRYDVPRPGGGFEERYWSPINSPVLGAEHEIKYIIHRVEDVTAFVRQKAKPRGDSDELLIRMEQMEAEIFQSSQRVQEANRQLETANKELESFSYSVSHDLRAPLRAIDGFSQALVEDYGPHLPDEGRRYLNIIRDGAQRMGMLIDDLLSFSRLSRVPVTRRPVDTARIVREVVEDLASQRQGRNIDLQIGELPVCDGDPALLKQVWVNLLSNAFKYSRRRDPAVVEVGCRRGAGEDVYFVRDNGAGFDMRYADKLFGVFQRLHLAEEYEGTGVGLAIVQRVIHRHGGKVWAESAVNQGATFYFTLGRNSSP
jgi:PAS domain S-box-containing protein